MRSTLAILTLLLAQGLQTPAADALKRLRARLPVVLVQTGGHAGLSGRYTGQTSELQARVGPFLSGEELYLFPDGSYLYCQWADVMQRTIFDKGRWSAAGGVLELVSDPDVTWDPDLGRRHVMVRRAAQTAEIMLLELPGDVEYFERETAEDPQLMLLIVGMARVDALSGSASRQLKDRLMREAWDPKFFRRRPPAER